jgi:hypothetical protein
MISFSPQRFTKKKSIPIEKEAWWFPGPVLSGHGCERKNPLHLPGIES